MEILLRGVASARAPWRNLLKIAGVGLLTAVGLSAFAQTAANTGFGKSKVIGYYLPSPEFPVSSIDAPKAAKLTHINYAFVTVKNGSVVFLDSDKNASVNVQQLNQLKQANPKLKVCAALGGWAETNFDERAKNNRNQYEAVLASDAAIQSFAKNVKSFMQSNGFDCFDIDMEHPGWVNNSGPSIEGFKEAYNFGKLLKALRSEFGTANELSIAGTGSFWFLQFHYPFIKSWTDSVDTINLMTYDLAGTWDKWTGHNAPIYASRIAPPELANSSDYWNFMREAAYLEPSWGPLAKEAPGSVGGRFPKFPLTADTIVKELRMMGVPKAKIVLGVPFYGRAFKGVPATNNGLFQLHQTEGGDPYPGDPKWLVGCKTCAARNEPRFITYAEVKPLIGKLGYTKYFDAESMVPYLYNASKGLFITYDDVTSIKHKAAYILENGLGGGMFWHLGQDTATGELLNALHAVLNGAKAQAAQFTTKNSTGARYQAWLPSNIPLFTTSQTYAQNSIVKDASGNVWRAVAPQAAAQPNGNTGWAMLGVLANEGVAFHPKQVEQLGTGDFQSGVKVTLATTAAATTPSSSTSSATKPSSTTAASTSPAVPTVAAVTPVSATAASPGFGKHKIIGYYLPSPEFPVSAIDAAKATRLTHINYAFVTVKNNQVVFLDADKDAVANVKALVALKKVNPNLKICASLGGWAESNFDERVKNNRVQYEAALATDATRLALARSAKAFMQANGFDCFDLDMEHPGWVNNSGPSIEGFKEAANFGKLLTAMKTEFGGTYGLSIAGTGSFWFLQFHYPFIKSWVDQIDTINLMSYDLAGTWDKWTGHNAPIYASMTPPPGLKSSSDFYNFMRDAGYLQPAWENLVRSAPGSANGRFPNFPLTQDTIVKELRMIGVPKSKIVLGVPFYGRSFKGVPATNNGLFQSHATEGGDPYTGDPSWIVGCPSCVARKEPRFVTYNEITQMLAGNFGYVSYWDKEALVPYMYNAAKGIFVTYDNPTSIKHKAAYIIENGLGGGMFWHLGQDTKSGDMLVALHSTLNGTAGEAAKFATTASAGARYAAWDPLKAGIETYTSGKSYSYNALVKDSAGNVWRGVGPQANAAPNGNTGWALLGVMSNEGIAFHPKQVEQLGNGDFQGGMKVTLANVPAVAAATASTGMTSGVASTQSPAAVAPVGVPGVPQIAWMSPSAAIGSTVTVKWDMWWGKRGDQWRLLANGQAVGPNSSTFVANGPLTEQGAQSGSTTYVLKGATDFQVELCAGTSCTKSAVVKVLAQ